MTQRTYPRILITHSWSDRKFVQELIDYLQEKKFSVPDVYHCEHEDFDRDISPHLDNKCDIYIPIISAKSIASKRHQRAIEDARGFVARPGRERPLHIIPVLIEDLDSLPESLESMDDVKIDVGSLESRLQGFKPLERRILDCARKSRNIPPAVAPEEYGRPPSSPERNYGWIVILGIVIFVVICIVLFTILLLAGQLSPVFTALAPTLTPSSTIPPPSATAPASLTWTPTFTPSQTPTPTVTATVTRTPTRTVTKRPTPSPIPSPSFSPTPNLPPGIYVVSLETIPAPADLYLGIKVGFKIELFNNTGAKESRIWQVKVYECNPKCVYEQSRGESPKYKIDIPTGRSTFSTQKEVQELKSCDWEAEPLFIGTGDPEPFPKNTDQKPLYQPVKVCR